MNFVAPDDMCNGMYNEPFSIHPFDRLTRNPQTNTQKNNVYSNLFTFSELLKRETKSTCECISADPGRKMLPKLGPGARNLIQFHVCEHNSICLVLFACACTCVRACAYLQSNEQSGQINLGRAHLEAMSERDRDKDDRASNGTELEPVLIHLIGRHWEANSNGTGRPVYFRGFLDQYNIPEFG